MTAPTLRTYQVADLAFHINRPKTPNLSDPGTGKTPTTCVYMWYLWSQLSMRSVWVMPKSLMHKNKEELLIFTHFKSEDIVILEGSPKEKKAMMQSDAKIFIMTAHFWAKEWRNLLEVHPDIKGQFFDEWHLMYSGHTSKRTEAMYIASRTAYAFVPMTGTAIKGRLSSVYPMLHVCAPQFYGNYAAFMNYHAVKDEYGSIMFWKGHERLKQVLAAVSIRHTFEEVYGKEAKVIQVEKCPMHPKQRAAYSEFEAKAILELSDDFLTAGTPGVEAIRCRQICSHPETFGIIPIGDQTGKDERMWVHIEDSIQAEEPLVIFASLVPEQERILAQLKARNLRAALINGSVSGPKRKQIDEAFRARQLDFIVASPPTAGVGFNWGFLNKMIFASMDYQDDSFIQAYRRGIRGKRESPLLIIVLEYEDSIDQRMFEIVDQKSKDASLVEDGKEAFNLSGKPSVKPPGMGGVSMKEMM